MTITTTSLRMETLFCVVGVGEQCDGQLPRSRVTGHLGTSLQLSDFAVYQELMLIVVKMYWRWV
jgi:hypothetical protein